MRRLAALIVVAALAVSPLTAQEGKTPEPNVTGKWTMTIHPDHPHGMTTGLVLEQKGTKVTGTFSSPHGDMAVEGELVGDQLKLATTEGDTDSRITFDARLKNERTLTGYLSSPMGDMEWTADRVTPLKNRH